MLSTPHAERLALALREVIDLPRADAQLVDASGTRFCFLGGLALIAGRQGAPIALDRDPAGATFVVGGEPAARYSRSEGGPLIAAVLGDCEYVDDPFPATIAASEWFGVDLAEITIDPAQMPEPLRDALDERLTVAHLRYPVRAKLLAATGHHPEGGWFLWALSDLGVPFDLLADAMRVACGVDRERVDGTLEHALAASMAAMATTSAAAAVTA